MNIKCLLGFHQYEFSRYSHPYQIKRINPIGIAMDGTLIGGGVTDGGFFHYGLVSDCARCGKTIDSEDMSLPIIEPFKD